MLNKRGLHEIVSLKNATADRNEGSVELFSYYGSLEISVKATDEIVYVDRNVIVIKDLVNKVMVDFPECTFKI